MPDPTTDPSFDTFLDVDSESPFPIQNLPYGVFTPPEASSPRVGAAIGDQVLDLALLTEHDLFSHPQIQRDHPFATPSLNAFMAMGASVWADVRTRIHTLLRADTAPLRDTPSLQAKVFHDRDAVSLHLPVEVGDYTDFYSSEHHARNVGTMFRGAENALQPNWKHLPVGYHGRASSIIPSGTDVRRPCGQTRPNDDKPPIYGPSQLLDFELEMGFFTGPGNPRETPIPIDETPEHIFGFCLVNDWSARDIQGWEYVPLGPFLGKSFATTISPWVVPMAALQPFRVPSPDQDPEPLPYLQQEGDWAFDVTLKVDLQTEGMTTPTTICRSNFRHMYWTACQQLAHHTVNGCNTRPGDLMASGTLSGPTEDSYGSMLELSWRGENPIELPNGDTRSFLEDGDCVVMRGYAQGDGYRVGFGPAEGTILPAPCT
jgi:fumarylacetoacetase